MLPISINQVPQMQQYGNNPPAQNQNSQKVFSQLVDADQAQVAESGRDFPESSHEPGTTALGHVPSLSDFIIKPYVFFPLYLSFYVRARQNISDDITSGGLRFHAERLDN